MSKNLLIAILVLISFQSLAQIQVLHSKCLGGGNLDGGTGFCFLPGNEYIICGSTASGDGDVQTAVSGSSDAWIIWLDSTLTVKRSYTYGGMGGEGSQAILQFGPNLFIIYGLTNSYDWPSGSTAGYADLDLFLLATDSMGTELWSRRLGGGDFEYAARMIKSRDGNIIVAARTESTNHEASGSHGHTDGLLIKVDLSGQIIWSECIGDIGDQYFNNISESVNGDLLMAGRSGSDMWLVRCDSSGNVKWQRTFGGSFIDEAYSVIELSSGNLLLAGEVESVDGIGSGNHGSLDLAIVCTDSSGSVQWSRCYGGSGLEARCFSIFELPNDDVLVASVTLSTDGDVLGNNGYADNWFLRLDTGGNIQDSYCLGGSNEEQVYAQGTDLMGNYFMVGLSYSNNGMVSGNHGLSDVWVVSYTTLQSKIDELGGRSFTLYPNPGNDHVVINLSEKTPQDLYVKDLTGRVIKCLLVLENPMNCRLEDMGPGIYFIGSPEVGYQRYVKVE